MHPGHEAMPRIVFHYCLIQVLYVVGIQELCFITEVTNVLFVYL